MSDTIDTVLKTLKDEKKRLNADLDRIDSAILALPGVKSIIKPFVRRPVINKARDSVEEPTINKSGPIKWSREVNKVFTKLDKVKPNVVIDALIENGVPGLDNLDTKKKGICDVEQEGEKRRIVSE